MKVNQKIYVISFILLWFVLNIFLYIFSDNYRYFLQSLKNDNIKVDDKFDIKLENLDKNYNIQEQDDLFSWLAEDFNNEENNLKENNVKKDDKDKKINQKTQNIKNFQQQKEVVFKPKQEEIKLTNIEKNILKQFKTYNLKEVKLHPRLFDLTSEYPDKYFEYYSKDLTLYFFGNKDYEDLRDIFEVLSYELPFSINEVNNFWVKSFYINLENWFWDGFVRIVLQYKNRTFWIKIKKDLYNKIKTKLGLIFKK